MSEPLPTDKWDEGDAYELYVGRWSRPVAGAFLAWLGARPALTWLDVGCGTGALAEAIVTHAEPERVFAVEPSAAFLARARRRLGERVNLSRGDAAHLPLPDASADVAVSGLVLNFVPNLDEAFVEMRRVVRPGGVIAAYVWDYAEGMEMMRHFWDAAAGLHPAATALDEGVRFPLCRPDALAQAFTRAGLGAVAVAPIVIDTPFRNFEAYWEPFLGGQGPAPSFLLSLDEAGRRALRDRLQERLPVNADGSIALRARAWAVRGSRS